MEKYVPTTMNIELTTCCPLHCPQCYCSLEGGKHIPLETAKKRIDQAHDMGTRALSLSGGETLCYPWIYELIEYASKRIESVFVALSGCYFDQKVFEKLVSSGVGGIFISLNGSTKEINSLTRDGFELAVKALELLSANKYENTFINWVMHSNNADDFENVIDIAEKYNVNSIVVLGFKPDAKHELKSVPSREQMEKTVDIIKNRKTPVELMIESCYSPLLALRYDTPLFGCLNLGPNKGCRAGRGEVSVNVDGLFSPCRHLDIFEDFDTLKEYWNRSETLKKLRRSEENKKEPCLSCKYTNNCRHCMAINVKLGGGMYLGNEHCPLACS